MNNCRKEIHCKSEIQLFELKSIDDLLCLFFSATFCQRFFASYIKTKMYQTLYVHNNMQKLGDDKLKVPLWWFFDLF